RSIRSHSFAFERPVPAQRKTLPRPIPTGPPLPLHAIGGRVPRIPKAAGPRPPVPFPLFSLFRPSGLMLRLPACPHPKHKPSEELWCANRLPGAADSFILFVDRLRCGSQNKCPQSQLSATLRV